MLGFNFDSFFQKLFPIQIVPLDVKSWTTRDNGEKGFEGFYALPASRTKSIIQPGETYKVCVLGQAACFCSLNEAYNDGEVHVPKDLRGVHIWSDSECENALSSETYNFRANYLKVLYPGNEAKVPKGKVNKFEC
jgi:hypothetical protein